MCIYIYIYLNVYILYIYLFKCKYIYIYIYPLPAYLHIPSELVSVTSYNRTLDNTGGVSDSIGSIMRYPWSPKFVHVRRPSGIIDLMGFINLRSHMVLLEFVVVWLVLIIQSMEIQIARRQKPADILQQQHPFPVHRSQ